MSTHVRSSIYTEDGCNRKLTDLTRSVSLGSALIFMRVLPKNLSVILKIMIVWL